MTEEKIETPSGEKIVPPYLSLGSFEKLFDLLAKKNFDKKITAKELQNYGFGYSDSYLCIATLRFLGLVNERGEVTQVMKKMHLEGDAKKEALKNIIKDAYQEIFHRDKDKRPYDLPEDQLANDFTVLYGVTPRIKRSAVMAFKWLCGKSGFIDEKEIPVKTFTRSKKEKRNPAVDKKDKSMNNLKNKYSENTSADQDNGKNLILPILDGIKLYIPYENQDKKDEIMAAVLKGELTKIFEEIEKFSTSIKRKPDEE